MHIIAYVEIGEGPRLKCYKPPDLAIHEGDECIIEADKVLEFGYVTNLEDGTADSFAEKHFPRVIRRATLQDQAKAKESALMSKMATETCTAKAEKYKLEMRLVRVRYSFDRSVLVILFAAEERVEFREMVQEISNELHTRIEMKQIGIRDEAGIIGGLGPCGRNLCCCTWLHKFESINMKMAKIQRLSLNSGTISGMCGRLKCCLLYEYENYRELGRLLPCDGAVVKCPDGKGCVIGKDILAQRVRVRLDDERVLEYGADDVETIWSEKSRLPPSQRIGAE